MCLECGFYKGRMVVDMASKKQAREERLKSKKEAIKAQNGDMEETAPESETQPETEASDETKK
jgi:hypothetical protein